MGFYGILEATWKDFRRAVGVVAIATGALVRRADRCGSAQAERGIYFLRKRRATARPAKPAPRSSSVDGSGTDTTWHPAAFPPERSQAMGGGCAKAGDERAVKRIAPPTSLPSVFIAFARLPCARFNKAISLPTFLRR